MEAVFLLIRCYIFNVCKFYINSFGVSCALFFLSDGCSQTSREPSFQKVSRSDGVFSFHEIHLHVEAFSSTHGVLDQHYCRVRLPELL